VCTKYIDAYFRYRRYIIKINPSLLFPAWRKEHRKVIIVNGKKCGWAETRYGLIPLNTYKRHVRAPFKWIKHILREHLGLCCSQYEKGYIAVGIGHFRYAVLQSRTTSGYIACDVYDIAEQEPIGRFYFNQEISEVYLIANRSGVSNTLQVISGYVADSVVYSQAAIALNRTIKVILQ